MMYPGYPGGYPAPPMGGGDVQQMRARQIDSLQQYFPAMAQLERNTLFEVMVPPSQPNRRPIALRITLPAGFPGAAPFIAIVPTARHALVHPATGQILPHAHEGLRSWGPHCLLGKVVYEIGQKLAADPPADVSPYQSYPPQRQPSPPQSQPLHPPPPQQVQPPRARRIDAGSVALPNLEGKSAEELEDLLKDDAKFEALFMEIPAVAETKRVRDELRDGVAEMAKKNVQEAEKAEALQKEVEAKRNEAMEAKQRLDEKMRRKAELEKDQTPLALLRKLQEAARQAEDESDAIAADFLAGRLTATEFVKQYREKRTTFHARSAKRESLASATST